jgi:hypothetical protein
MNSYGRAYRIFGFGSLALVDLIFSIALSYSMGLVGFILPTLMIAVAYLLVECVLDLVIVWLDYRNRVVRRKRS